MQRLIKHKVKYEAAFTLIEMLISLAAMGILFAVLVVAAHEAFNVPAERSNLMSCKNNLIQALDAYYLNNYQRLHHATQLIAIDDLVTQHYLDKNSLYDTSRFKYTVGVRVVNGHDRLKLVIKTKTTDAESLHWMHPNKIMVIKQFGMWYHSMVIQLIQ